MTFFIGSYPPEAAYWCNDSGAYHITEIDHTDDGQRRFMIVENTYDAPTPAEIQEMLTEAVQDALDSFAMTRNYDGIMSVCSYAASSDPTFRREAEYCVRLRDDTWRAAYTYLDSVIAGERSIPSAEELIAELPIGSAQWPE